MKHATYYTPVPPPPDHRDIRGARLADASDGFSLRGRLKHFARYLGAVTNAHSGTAPMRHATYTSVPPPDHRDIREARSADASDSLGLREQLKHFARYLGAMTNAHFGTVAVKHATHTPVPPPPDRRATPEPDDAADGSGLLGWLKHFVLYLGAVAIIGLIGLYFLWQIPFVRDPSQILKIADDSRAPRPLAATVTPAAPAPPAQAAPSPPPVNSAAAPDQPPVPTDTIAATTSPPATPIDPAGALPPLEAQPAAEPDSQAEPATPPTEPTAEVVPSPTPQAEIEQLLVDAQQQMNNRRFTAPASGNALSTYRRVLELQPNHPVALDGIQRITTYYRDVAQQSLQQGRLDESLAYINRGLRAGPKSDALLNLRRQVQQVQKARQREQEQQQKQAALEEMQRQRLEQVRQGQPLRQQEQQPWWRQPSNSNDTTSGFNQR